MARWLALLFAVFPLVGCQTSGETIIGRINGRDVVVTEAEIQKRIDDRGVSRAVALRELRREQEAKAAIELQRKWKSSDNVYVENAKSRSGADRPESPNGEEIAERIANEQKRRAEARSARYTEEYADKSESDESDSTDEEEGDNSPPNESDEEIVSKLTLPEQKAKFENAPNTDGWQSLPERTTPPIEGKLAPRGK